VRRRPYPSRCRSLAIGLGLEDYHGNTENSPLQNWDAFGKSPTIVGTPTELPDIRQSKRKNPLEDQNREKIPKLYDIFWLKIDNFFQFFSSGCQKPVSFNI
jgi:hypothetical protein